MASSEKESEFWLTSCVGLDVTEDGGRHEFFLFPLFAMVIYDMDDDKELDKDKTLEDD